MVFENIVVFFYPTPNSGESGQGGIVWGIDFQNEPNLDLLWSIESYAALLCSFIDKILQAQHQKRAIQSAKRAANISILVDSFAHNVAAHSLTALSNYFAIRKNELERKDISEDIEYYGSERTVLTKSEINKSSSKAESEHVKVTDQEYTREQKGTISVSDIIKFGGDDYLLERLFQLRQPNSAVDNIFLPIPIDDSVYSFINYLSEKSEFWSAAIAGESFNNSIDNLFNLIWGFIDNPLFVGTLAGSENINRIKFVIDNKPFALVDFSAINEKKLSGNYQFVKPLDNFIEVKTYLSAKEVLLPGSNVGKQSVYTILENCLRNIKHYDISDSDAGEVEFHLNIEETDNRKQYSFEMYLGLTKYLNDKSADEVIQEVKAQINKGTYDKENSQPIFGGTSQSILCANHLVTGRFSDEENDKKYFNAMNANDLVKYTFNLWKGENVKSLTINDTIIGDDNISRYKFLAVAPNNDIVQIRKNLQNAIRILETSETKVDEVYREWLKYWLGNTNYECDLEEKKPITIKCGDKRLIFGHGEANNNERLVFRNHGIFKRDIEDKWNELKYNVAEAMLTGVYVIDNRLYNVFKEKKNKNKIEDELHLFVKEEKRESLIYNNIISIEGENNVICEKINFLIIHLSFIESLNTDYKKDINRFIEKIKTAINGRENLHLIITTGRGRTDWKKAIKEEYRHFVKHRSVFSLQNALLDGVMKGDDFNLKYNIIKVLFGS